MSRVPLPHYDPCSPPISAKAWFGIGFALGMLANSVLLYLVLR